MLLLSVRFFIARINNHKEITTMKIIEEKEIVTFQRYVSEDGQYSRSVRKLLSKL